MVPDSYPEINLMDPQYGLWDPVFGFLPADQMLEEQAKIEQNVELVTEETLPALVEGEPIPGLGNETDLMIRQVEILQSSPEFLATVLFDNPGLPLLEKIIPEEVLRFFKDAKEMAAGNIPEWYLLSQVDWSLVQNPLQFIALCFTTYFQQFADPLKVLGIIAGWDQYTAEGAVAMLEMMLKQNPWLATYDPNDKSTWPQWMNYPGTSGGVQATYEAYLRQLDILTRAIAGTITEAEKTQSAIDASILHSIIVGLGIVLGVKFGPTLWAKLAPIIASAAAWWSVHQLKSNIADINAKMDDVVAELKAILEQEKIENNVKTETTTETTTTEDSGDTSIKVSVPNVDPTVPVEVPPIPVPTIPPITIPPFPDITFPEMSTPIYISSPQAKSASGGGGSRRPGELRDARRRKKKRGSGASGEQYFNELDF